MKKVKLIVAVFLAAVLCIGFAGCADSEDKAIENAISEIRTDSYRGKGEIFSVTLSTGKREQPYAADGVSNDLVEFAVLTVTPKNSMGGEFSYSFSVNGKDYSGVFSETPYGISYAVDLKETLPSVREITVNINADTASEQIVLTNVLTENSISAEDALEKAKTEFADVLDGLISNGKLNAEIYIKLLNDRSNHDSKYYWYVAIVNKEAYYAVVINPETGEIVAKKDKPAAQPRTAENAALI